MSEGYNRREEADSPQNWAERFESIMADLRRVLVSQPSLGALHDRSTIEATRELYLARFWEPENLATFRSYRSPIRGGTMRWPNRRAKSNTIWIEPRHDWISGVWAMIGDYLEDRRGRRALRQLDAELMAECPAEIKHLITDTHCGQPFGITSEDGRFLTGPILSYGWFLIQLWRNLEASLAATPLIAEIGGGIGGLARLLKEWRPETKLVLIDFPQRLLLQAYFLFDAFPEMSCDVYAGDPETGADVTLMPTWRLPELKERVDLFINTQSFQEMTNEQVAYYLEHINRLCSGWFYCVNREEKNVGAEIVPHPRQALIEAGWDTIYERPQLWQPAILEGLYRVPSG